MTPNIDHLPAGIWPGAIVSGKYHIDRVVGTGAMGIVVAARHLLLDERVAIKFLLPHALDSRESVSRFLREARAAVKIKSEHVAHVHDIGVLDDETPYIVMELLEGSDLAQWLERRGPMPVVQAVELVLQACEAVAEAHSLGVVHRDLKPANLFVTQRIDGLQSVKVLDFGISKTVGGVANPAITDAITVMGSPSYMSPEQMESSRNVDLQTDIWALGAILCELVTGKLPYTGKSLPQVYACIVSNPQPSLRDLSPAMPRELETVVLKCLQRNRALRYRHVAEFASALAPFAPKRAFSSIERIARMFDATPPVSSEEPVPSPSSTSPVPRLIQAYAADKTLSSNGSYDPRRRHARHVVAASATFIVLLALALAIKWIAMPAGVSAASSPPYTLTGSARPANGDHEMAVAATPPATTAGEPLRGAYDTAAAAPSSDVEPASIAPPLPTPERQTPVRTDGAVVTEGARPPATTSLLLVHEVRSGASPTPFVPVASPSPPPPPPPPLNASEVSSAAGDDIVPLLRDRK